MTRRRFQASFRRVRTLTAGDWAASNPALAISRGPRGTPPQTPGTAAAFPACSCPLPLSLPGEPGDPGTSFPVPPDCVGDTTKRLTAHTGRARSRASGSPRAPMGCRSCGRRPRREDAAASISVAGDRDRGGAQQAGLAVRRPPPGQVVPAEPPRWVAWRSWFDRDVAVDDDGVTDRSGTGMAVRGPV